VFWRRHQAEAGKGADWRHFVAVFLRVLLGGTIIAYLFVLLVDPYDIVAFSLPLDRRIVSISQRYMYPQIVRSRRYDSLVVGTSSARLLDPKLLDKSFGSRFANLAMDAMSAWEQQIMIGYFLRKAGPPKVLIVGLDIAWCDQNADRNRITFRGFPDWLYDDNRWNDYLYLLNVGAVEIAGRLVGYQLGLYPERVRYDGYEVFVPPESQYDLARARQGIWHLRKPGVPPNVAPPSLSPDQRQALSFPALTWLDATLARLPSSSLTILAYVPIHVAAQPWPGTHAAAVEAECKARIAAIAGRHGAKVIDWRINSALTRDDSNFWDSVHFRVPIATRIATQLGPAILAGRESDDGSYRLVLP
jgi:hypothetical protein